MRQMVNGVTFKIDNYCYCGELLEGKRTKYCSTYCYNSFRKLQERKHYNETHPPLPKRICINCKKKYKPRTSRQECCSKPCRREIIAGKKRRRSPKVKASVHYKQFFVRQIYRGRKEIQELADEVTNISSSGFADEINNFLASGGKVKILADQLDGRVPGVGSTNYLRISKDNSGEDFAFTDGVDVSGDWDISTLSGFGYELHVMDSESDQD